MKKFISLVVVVIGVLFLVSCQKDSRPTGPEYTVEIAANKYASAVTTTHTVFEYDAEGRLVGTHTLSPTENGVKTSFDADSQAAYLTVRMDMEAKPSTGVRKSFYYSYMFILESGKANRVALDGSSPVQANEPSLK